MLFSRLLSVCILPYLTAAGRNKKQGKGGSVKTFLTHRDIASTASDDSSHRSDLGQLFPSSSQDTDDPQPKTKSKRKTRNRNRNRNKDESPPRLPPPTHAHPAPFLPSIPERPGLSYAAGCSPAQLEALANATEHIARTLNVHDCPGQLLRYPYLPAFVPFDDDESFSSSSSADETSGPNNGRRCPSSDSFSFSLFSSFSSVDRPEDEKLHLLTLQISISRWSRALLSYWFCRDCTRAGAPAREALRRLRTVALGLDGGASPVSFACESEGVRKGEYEDVLETAEAVDKCPEGAMAVTSGDRVLLCRAMFERPLFPRPSGVVEEWDIGELGEQQQRRGGGGGDRRATRTGWRKASKNKPQAGNKGSSRSNAERSREKLLLRLATRTCVLDEDYTSSLSISELLVSALAETSFVSQGRSAVPAPSFPFSSPPAPDPWALTTSTTTTTTRMTSTSIVTPVSFEGEGYARMTWPRNPLWPPMYGRVWWRAANFVGYFKDASLAHQEMWRIYREKEQEAGRSLVSDAVEGAESRYAKKRVEAVERRRRASEVESVDEEKEVGLQLAACCKWMAADVNDRYTLKKEVWRALVRLSGIWVAILIGWAVGLRLGISQRPPDR